MTTKFTNFLFATAIISLTACQKNSTSDEVVFETTSNDMTWAASGMMVNGQDVGNVIIDVPQLITISYTDLTIDEKYYGADWEDVPSMDPEWAINNNVGRNIYKLDATRGRTIRVYNIRRRGGPVSIRIRAHRRHR